MMRCGLCNSRTDMREMKYHRSGEYLICKSCHEKQSPGSRVVVESKPQTVREVAEVARKPSPKVSYRCKNCGYAFARARDHSFELCPYCGKKTVSVVQGGGAQNLLDTNF